MEREEAHWFDKCGYSTWAEHKWRRAYDYFRKAADTHRRVLSPLDYRLAIALSNLGQAAFATNRYAEAEACFREAVSINDSLKNGAKGSDQIDALEGLGHSLRVRRDHVEAMKCFDRAKQALGEFFGEDGGQVRAITAGKAAIASDMARPLFCTVDSIRIGILGGDSRSHHNEMSTPIKLNERPTQLPRVSRNVLNHLKGSVLVVDLYFPKEKQTR